MCEKLLRAGEGRLLRRLDAIAKAVNSLEEHYADLSDEELRECTEEYKQRYADGETLDETLPAYLNALSGKGVHIITVNDYLAQRDAEWMGQIHRFLGLTVGVILPNEFGGQHKTAYACDITYGTNNEFGFDYLRDNMAMSAEDLVQRGHHF